MLLIPPTYVASSIPTWQTTTENQSPTFTNPKDTNGISDYHATYPVWVYATTPSRDCIVLNQGCPTTKSTDLATFTAEKNHQDKLTAIVLCIIGTVIAVFFFVMLIGGII